jgi:hypothetical protein
MNKDFYTRFYEIVEMQGELHPIDVARKLVETGTLEDGIRYLEDMASGILPIGEIEKIARFLNIQCAELFMHDYTLMKRDFIKPLSPLWFVVMPGGDIKLGTGDMIETNAIRRYLETKPNTSWETLQSVGYRTEYLQLTFTKEDIRA